MAAVYSFYIFDRHTECIYSKRWTSPPSAQNRTSAQSALSNGEVPISAKRAMKLEDDAKLIFGTIFSLRRMVRQLGGEDDQFLSYRTGEYKLHYFETPTQLKLIMLTATNVGNMRTVLHQIWATLYVEYVVKNPISPIEHPKGVGVANELFEGGLESFMSTLDHVAGHYKTPAIVLLFRTTFHVTGSKYDVELGSRPKTSGTIVTSGGSFVLGFKPQMRGMVHLMKSEESDEKEESG